MHASPTVQAEFALNGHQECLISCGHHALCTCCALVERIADAMEAVWMHFHSTGLLRKTVEEHLALN